MDFQETCTFFGGTIFYDDLRGNLEEARAELDRLQRETPLPSLDNSAKLLLLRALWHLLSGNFQEALDWLDCLIDGDIYGKRWTFRGSAYMALLYTWRKFPPLFKFCDLNGPAFVTWKRRFPDGRALRAISYCKEHSKNVSMMDLFEFRVIKADCELSHVVKRFALQLNPLSEDHEDNINQREARRRYVSASKIQLKKLRHLASQLSLPAVAAYLSRLLYEISHSEGLQESYLHLEFMNDCYVRMQDQIGIGLYWLIRGDYNSSPSFTSPLVFNFDIVDGPDEFGGDSRMFHSTKTYNSEYLMESQSSFAEFGSFGQPLKSLWHLLVRKLTEKLRKHPEMNTGISIVSKEDKQGQISIRVTDLQRRLSIARDCYSKADAHFAMAKSARGSAATALRKACTFIIEDMQIPGSSISSQHNDEIQTLLVLAQSLCGTSGDVQLGKLVQMQLLLASTLTYESRFAARDLGIWAEESGNEIFGLCLGLLAFRAGLYFRYHCGSMSSSMKALETSRQLIKSMEMFRTVWFQIMLAQASISKSQGNLCTAKIWHGHLKNNYNSLAFGLFSNIDGEFGAANPDDDELYLTIFQHYVKMTLGSIVSIDSQIGEPSLFPDPSTKELMDFISPIDNNPLTQQWLKNLDLDMKYKKTVVTHRRLLADGNLKDANLCLQAFLRDEDVISRDDLQAHAYIIDIYMTLGEIESARARLSLINDEDSLPRQYVAIGRGRSAEEKRYEERRLLKSLEIIFLSCIRTTSWERASRLLSLLENASPGFFTSVTSYTKLWPWQRCLYAGLVREQEGQYNLATHYFLQSWLFVMHAQRSIRIPEDRRLMWESPDVARLVSSLTRRSLRWKMDMPDSTKLKPVSDPRIDNNVFPIFGMTVNYGNLEHYDEALLLLETGRARYVWESSSSAVDLEQQVIEANYKYRKWLELMSKDNRKEDEESEFLILDAEKEQFTAFLLQSGAYTQSKTKKAKPGSRDMLFPFTIEELCEGIPANAIVIYPALSDDSMALFAVDQTGIKMLALDKHTNAELVRITVLAYIDEIVTGKGNPDSDPSQMEFLGDILSRLLIDPVEKCIAKREHVIFVPSGDLMRLPFGALKFHGDYLGLQKQVSQVPSLSTIRHLRLHRHAAANNEGSSRTMSIIARPEGIKNSNLPHEQNLPMAGIESSLIGVLAGTGVMKANEVSTTEFQDHLKSSNLLHICTHGYNDTNYPMDSYIILKQRFRVLDMLAVRTEVNLVVFSACLSATGQASESGDIQGFSHAVLAAGANAYLGALWSVDDVATMIHMYFFYSFLFVMLDTPSFAEAWHFATKMLYEMNTAEIIRLLQKFVDQWDRWSERGGESNNSMKGGKRKLMRLIRDLKTEGGAKMLNLKHPYFWAPFAMVGNGSMRVQTSIHNEFMNHVSRNLNTSPSMSSVA